MKIFAKNHSSYPRVGNNPEQQKLRRAYNQLDKGAIKPDEVARILDETVAETIQEQISCGCDLVTDGQIRTYDPVSYLAGSINGFAITGLLRFFDTNFLFRQPKIVGKLTRNKPIAVKDYEFTRLRADSKATAVMFGPYSLLKMSTFDDDFEKLLNDLCEIYIEELKDLHDAGAPLVQLDEPAIIHNAADLDRFQQAYGKIMNVPGLPEILIAFYFGDVTPHIDKLNDLPVNGMVFDFDYSPGLMDALAGYDKDIGLGIINGRNTKLENVGDLARKSETIMKNVNSDKIYITSSCGLEFLPRDRAMNKLKLAVEVAAKLKGGT